MHTIHRVAALATLCALSAAWAQQAPADPSVRAAVRATSEAAAKVAPVPASHVPMLMRERRCTACHSSDVAGSQPVARIGGSERTISSRA
jgi:hypothetical protein